MASSGPGPEQPAKDLSLLVVAAEASGDAHAAAVVRELRLLRPELRAFGSAGPLLRAQGVEALVRVEDLSVMGIAEVIPALPRIFRALGLLRRAAAERRPRAALLVDSPDFNLRLAKRLRRLGIPVVGYIGPSVWAWRRGRVKQIAHDVARMLVILPFEAAFYARHGVRATFVGNPVADQFRAPAPEPDAGRAQREARAALGLPEEAQVLALLPGSRRQEIERLLPVLLSAGRLLAAERPGLVLLLPVAATLPFDELASTVAALAPGLAVRLLRGQAELALAACDAAVVKSGTGTLQAALAQAPQVVVYRTSWLSYLVGRLLLRVRFIGLVNLLADRALAPELVQSACTPQAIADEVGKLLSPGPSRALQLEGLSQLRGELAPPGSPAAAKRAACELLEVLEAK